MLDKYLCKQFNVPPYLEWIQNKLDELEDKLYDTKLDKSSTEYVEIKSKYDALIEARNTYCALRKGRN